MVDKEVDYKEEYKNTTRNVRAMRVVGLKVILALLCREYGDKKVKEELESLIKDDGEFS